MSQLQVGEIDYVKGMTLASCKACGHKHNLFETVVKGAEHLVRRYAWECSIENCVCVEWECACDIEGDWMDYAF